MLQQPPAVCPVANQVMHPKCIPEALIEDTPHHSLLPFSSLRCLQYFIFSVHGRLKVRCYLCTKFSLRHWIFGILCICTYTVPRIWEYA